MLDALKHTFSTVGETTSDYAKRFATSATALAKRVGPKRGITALVILSAGIGAAFVVRFLRNRRHDIVVPGNGVRSRTQRHDDLAHQSA